MEKLEYLRNEPKYNLFKYSNTLSRKVIYDKLKISQPTFYRKANAKICDQNNFDLFQLKVISDILERPIMDLITNEAKLYYGFINVEI